VLASSSRARRGARALFSYCTANKNISGGSYLSQVNNSVVNAVFHPSQSVQRELVSTMKHDMDTRNLVIGGEALKRGVGDAVNPSMNMLRRAVQQEDENSDKEASQRVFEI
jgi:hypothetical protein